MSDLANSSFKGLAIGSVGSANYLYATDFANSAIQVFNTSFAPTTLGGGFTDPASTATTPPFTMTFHDYVRTELNYKTDLPYYTSAQQSGMFLWSSTATTPAPGGNQGFQEEISPLRAAIVGNPFLKVLVMEGFYDLATPYYQAEYTMHELNLPAQYQKNISYERYWSGHMVYLEQKSHAKMQKDWDGFVEATQGK